MPPSNPSKALSSSGSNQMRPPAMTPCVRRARPMERRRILQLRMANQLLLEPAGSIPAAAERMLALQSQDLAAGRYALAQRSGRKTSRADVDALFTSGALVRSWTMRGTLHICAAGDVRWLVRAARRRTLAAMAPRLREVQIGAADIDAAGELVFGHLKEHGCASRATLFTLLNQHGIPTAAQRGVHLLMCLVMDGLLCLGPIPEGAGLAGQDFMLVDELAAADFEPAEPLQELLRRYLAAHGPASLRDAAWYTGQTLTQLKAAAADLGPQLYGVGLDAREEELYLLADCPALDAQLPNRLPLRLLGHFDEYYLSYADRSLAADAPMQASIGPGKNGMVKPFWLRSGRADTLWNAEPAPTDRIGAALHQRYLGFRA